MPTLLGFVLSMSATMVFMPLLMRWAVPLRFLDMPEARKVHETPIPRVGGIAMAGGVVAALLLWAEATRATQALLLGIAILMFFGIWDDRRPLSAGPKFAGQALAALVAMFWGGVSIATVTLAERYGLPTWAAMPLTFLFLLGGTNAFNLADGLDGLAGGMAVLCFCGTALLAFTVGNVAVGSAAVVFIGAVIGFLRFNTHPARVFMGDGGSQMLGYAAAVLAIRLTQDPQVPLSSALPLLLMGMPIIDTLMVMTERLAARQSPFKADRRHIHHRLLALGLEHWEAVSILYLLQGLLFVAAWFLRFESDLGVVAVFGLFAASVLVFLRVAQRLHWRVRDRPEHKLVAVTGRIARDPGARTAPAAELLLGGTICVYGLWVLIYGAEPSGDVRALTLILAAVLGASTLMRWRRDNINWIEKIALYSSATLALYLSKRGSPAALHPSLVEWVLFPAMIVAVVLSIHASRDRLFRLTPLDILVLLVVITVPNLPDSVASERALGLGVAELVVLFYALEALSFAAKERGRWLRAAVTVFLFGLALRTLL